MANEIINTQNPSQMPMMVGDIMNVNVLKQRAAAVCKIKAEIMQENVHFGKIPGCGDKPTLLKNGAELLCMAFKLAPSVDVKITDMGNGHREYTVTTILSVIGTGEMVASGIGSCSTMESKYRYRGTSVQSTGKSVPKDYWTLSKSNKEEAQKLLGGNGFVAKKDENGAWMIFKKGSEKQENPDIADQYNTVLKMASKRSLVDAVLKATGGSCEFTQDLEDIKEYTEYTQVYETPTKEKPIQNQEQQTQPTNSAEESNNRFVNVMNSERNRIGDEQFYAVLSQFMNTIPENLIDIPINLRGKIWNNLKVIK